MNLYFPEPYEDEILYSTIARYHYYVGNNNTKYTIRELFGTEAIIPTIELTSNLKKFCKYIGNSIYNLDYFINKHTNLPFYAPFLKLDNRVNIREMMINSDGKGIYAKIGITAGGICTKRGLYYCPQCVIEDVKNVGEAYFHRIHQVPGVLVCPTHSCLIKQYKITRNNIGRINFIKLNLRYIDNNIHYMDNTIISNYLVKIANSAKYILNSDLNKFNQLSITKKYKTILNEKGLLTLKKRVKQKKLIKLFKNYYGEELLDILQSNINNKESNWLRIITRKPKRTIHPIRHILFILFLCDDIKSFFEENKKTNYICNQSVWPCLNPAADHYKKLVIDKCKITSDYKTREPVATFKCECGFTYSRKINNKGLNDIYKIGRVKSYGEVWEKKLLQIISLRKYSIRELGRIMKCDPKTIVKYARKLGKGNIVDSEMKLIENKHSITINKNYSEKYSKDILKLINKNPEYTRTQVRKALKKQYAWFYRNDKDWLNKNLPPIENRKKKNNVLNTRVDWNKRDNKIYLNIKRIYIDLINNKKMIRITKSIIGRKLGISALLDYYLDMLPKTKEYLNKITETTEEFQIRRVNILCRCMIEKNIELKIWKIMREAGIKPSCSSKVLQKINYYLKLQSNHKIMQ